MYGLCAIFSEDPVDLKLHEEMIRSIDPTGEKKREDHYGENAAVSRIHHGSFSGNGMAHADDGGSKVLFLEGMIYYGEEERSRLERKGYKFSENHCAQYCLYSYLERGEEFINDLNGDFLILILDKESGEVLIFTDLFGLRPHFYHQREGKLTVSPKIRGILKDPDLKKELFIEGVMEFFAYGGTKSGNTFFKGIKLFPPASKIKFNENGIEISRYSDKRYETDHGRSDEDFASELVDAFKAGISSRMEQDLRYGVSLSGGLDSRAILGAIRSNGKNVSTFSFGDGDTLELKIARKTAKHYGCTFKHIEMPPGRVIESFTEHVRESEGLSYLGFSHDAMIYRDLSKEIDVIFEGFALGTILGGQKLSDEVFKLKDEKDLERYIMKKMRIMSDPAINRLFKVSVRKGVSEDYRQVPKKEIEEIGGGNFPDRIDSYTMNYRLISYIFYGTHLISFDHLEHGFPTLDSRFYSIIRKIPPELRRDQRIIKLFLKQLDRSLLDIPYNAMIFKPKHPRIIWKLGKKILVLNRRIKNYLWIKTGGRMDLPDIFKINRDWYNFYELFMRNDKWIEHFNTLLLSDGSRVHEYLDRDYIREMLEGNRRGLNYSPHLLYIATFELFLREFF